MHNMPRTGQVRARPARTWRPLRPSDSRAARRLLWAPLVAVAVAGCSGGGHVKITDSSQAASPSPTASSPSATPSARDQVLSQYRAFWARVPSASAARASQRRALLAPYTDDPELSSLLRGMAQQDARGEEIYGENVPHPKISRFSLAQGLAVISDCQDSSRSGVERRSDHKRITVGVKANPVVATMRRGADGRWRVSFVSYPKSSC